MEASRVCGLCVWLLLCLLPCAAGINTSFTKHESIDLGHIRYENGTLEWGAFPIPINSSERQAEKRSSAWDSTVDFALAIVDSVQTRNFPYDLLRRIIQNSYSEDEVRRYQTNVVVVTAVGAVLAVAILVSMLVYLLVRWRRGQKDTFLLYIPELNPIRAKAIVGFGTVVMLVDLMFVIYALVASGYALTGALKLDDAVNDAMDDVTKYFDGLKQQYEFITARSSNWLIQDVMLSDLNNIGLLVWETGREEFLPQINSTFQKVADLDSKAAQALSLLSTLDTDMAMTLSGVGGVLDSVLTAVHYNLTSAVADYTCFGCDGSCSRCSQIVPDDIFLNADLKLLPNISSNMAALRTLLNTPVAGSSQSPENYFTYGIADVLSQNANVTTAKDWLTQDLLSYGRTWGNATSNALYPNDSTFWFDTLRPQWDSFCSKMEVQEISRFTFILLFSILTIGAMGVTVYTAIMTVQRGLFKDLTGKEDFSLPRKLLGWCIVGEVALASCHLAMSAAGFYTGANLQKAVCKPGENWDVVNQVIDYPSAMPGHPGYFLSSVLLGNGTLGPVKMADVLTACSNDSTAYSLFFHNLLMPSMQQDLQNYSQHFTGHEALFDLMRINLDGVTLVPPDFVTWLANFTSATDFNYTQYTELLNGNVINADVDVYTANLMTVYNTAFPDGPMEPAKSRLSIAAGLLHGQKANLASFDQIKNNLATVFANFTTVVADIQTTANQTMKELLALEPMLHAMAANAISRGVDQYAAEVLYLLNEAANQTWPWIGEAGACGQLRDAYNSAVSSFCDNYADYQNASWLLLGHTCLFLLVWTALSFVVYRSIPEQVNTETGEDDFQGNFGVRHALKARLLFIEDKARSEIVSPVPEIAVTPANEAAESWSDSSDGRHSDSGRPSVRTARAVTVDFDNDYSGSPAQTRSKASYVEYPRRSKRGQVAPFMPRSAATPEMTQGMWSAEPKTSSASSFMADGDRSVTSKRPVMKIESLD